MTNDTKEEIVNNKKSNSEPIEGTGLVLTVNDIARIKLINKNNDYVDEVDSEDNITDYDKFITNTYRELVIISKMEFVLNSIYPKLRTWPKSEKFALSQSVRNSMLHFIKNMGLANKVPSKRTLLAQEADGDLQFIKTQLRLARDLKYISLTQYEGLALSLSEIGKLVVAYIKSSVRVSKNKNFKEVNNVTDNNPKQKKGE
ncbi:MAG: four helix bundle protein [Arcobacter sp.]